MTSPINSAETASTLAVFARERPTQMQAAEWAAQALRSAMDAGILTPGAQLTEEALAAVLDVSRNTLRQAFTELEAQHLVRRIPHRGVFVAAPDREQVREVFVERWAVESAAIDLASADENKDARAALVRAREAYAQGRVADMAGANQDFHRALVAAAGSVRLNQAMSRLLAEMRLMFFEHSEDFTFHAPYVELNAELLELVEGGQKEAAHRALRSYLTASRNRFLRQTES